MFQSARPLHPRSRVLANRKPVGDENSVVGTLPTKKGTTVSHNKANGLKTKSTHPVLGAGKITLTRSTMLAAKPRNIPQGTKVQNYSKSDGPTQLSKPHSLRPCGGSRFRLGSSVADLSRSQSMSRGDSAQALDPKRRNSATLIGVSGIPSMPTRTGIYRTVSDVTLASVERGSVVPSLEGETPVVQVFDESCVIDTVSVKGMEWDHTLSELSVSDSERTDTDDFSVGSTVSLEQSLERVHLEPGSLEYIMRTFEEEIDPYDTTMVPEYASDIFRYMRQREVQMLPRADYMANQKELEWSMRGILIDWLVQVHQRFRLLPETLFLCINYIDRFLSLKAVSLDKLQLVGTTALLVATKFEEIQVPSVTDFVYMVDYAYNVDEILKAERYMVSMLGFDLGFPGPLSFLRRISKADDYDIQTRTLAKYLIEVTIVDERFLPFTISKIAAAGHYLARRMLAKGAWTDAHVYYSEYTEAMILPLVDLILDVLARPKSHPSIFEKYSDRKFMKASLFVQQWLTAHSS
ncbi:B-type cyclin [Dispira simplex]|nr:B-type cyclin [Dispira simplex]